MTMRIKTPFYPAESPQLCAEHGTDLTREVTARLNTTPVAVGSILGLGRKKDRKVFDRDPYHVVVPCPEGHDVEFTGVMRGVPVQP